jgi:multidrug efflux pump subunit AcrA (membrane-fusion protein)
MKRTLLVLSLAAAIGMAAGLACGKKAPGPTPEPTPAPTIVVVEPTPSTDAVCAVANLPAGTPPICKDAAGAQVVCPVDTSALPECK